MDAPAPHAASGAHLFLSLECARPLAGPARFALDDTDEITFGRGAARAFVREGRDGRRCLAIRVPDPRMSGSHARLVRLGQGFLFEDLGSTNGSLLDGRPVQRAPVTDGARLELGSTIFILRLGMATPPGTAPDVDGASAIGGVAGLATVIPALGEALGKLARVAASTVPVLLLGETGSGKEVLARAVHALSGRGGPFVPVNCGALPEALVEGQLFGHLRGAFSGAVRDEPGLVRASHGGTLFLDEIGDLPRASQAALLRVLQEREVTPVGATRAIPVDLRVIAATHRRVDAAGGFRNDLYARLAGFTHHLDPLRDRREDLGVLVASLLAAASPERADRIRLSPAAGRALFTHAWPLNVRELAQALSVAVVLAEGGVIDLQHLPEALRAPAAPPAPKEAPALSPEDEKLRAALIAELEARAGNISEVARSFGKTRMQIHRWMHRFGVDGASYRRGGAG